ncbi:MAG: hypothetical protein GF313_08095 [Caldithrix sp.]|nr:hypothetical protein [Caldithrix sp.]
MSMRIYAYYKDSYLTKLTTRVNDIKHIDNDSMWIKLDDTVFYPGGGGQASDKGTLNHLPVDEVKREGDDIWHRLSSTDSIKTGAQVNVSIDWPHRYYNMQQHSGQHLLSSVLNRFGYPTVSVHLGDIITLIEIENGVPEDQKLAQIESEANALIRAAKPIQMHITSPSEAGHFPLRRAPVEVDELRIVQMEDADCVACGGTHVRNTSEIGYIKIAGTEKIRGRVRVQCYIGKMADEYFSGLHQSSEALKKLLNTDYDDFPERVKQLLADKRTYKREKNKLEQTILEWKARDLVTQLEPDAPVVHHIPGEHVAEQAFYMARFILNELQKTTLITANERFYLGVPPLTQKDAREFMNEHGQRFGMKGGGSPDFVQGKAKNLPLEQIEQALHTWLERS